MLTSTIVTVISLSLSLSNFLSRPSPIPNDPNPSFHPLSSIPHKSQLNPNKRHRHFLSLTRSFSHNSGSPKSESIIVSTSRRSRLTPPTTASLSLYLMGIKTLKLIKPDGEVEIFSKPVKASEQMILHPNYLICRSDSFTIGQKLPAIQEKEFLQLGHSYFLLPAQFFQSTLSFAAIARASINGGKLLHCKFDVHKTPSGNLKIRVSEDFTDRKKQAGARVCTTEELEKDYQKMVGGEKSKHWKPKLETIMEGRTKKKRWVLGSPALSFLGCNF